MAMVIAPPETPSALLITGVYGADMVLFAGGALSALGVKDGAPYGVVAAMALLVLFCVAAVYKEAAAIGRRA